MPVGGRFDAVGLIGGERGVLRGAAREYVVEVRGEPSCSIGCPAGVNVKAYVNLIASGRFEEAVDIIREANPFPAVCGRVCTRPCEAGCEQGRSSDPVAIRALKRHAADVEMSRRTGPPAPCEVGHDERVAIVGAGPAGLTAAVDLVRMGYQVTVFEAGDEPGGMLRYGIPPNRLPKDVLRHEIDWIRGLGVEIRTGEPVEDPAVLLGGYDAVLIAGGAPVPLRLGIENEEADGVIDALTFLRWVNTGRRPGVGRSVVVIGGGSTAFDAARSAIRLGAREVTLAYRRGRAEMPASPEEVADAEAEGVRIVTLAIPKGVVVERERVTGVRFLRAELGEPDDSGRPRPVPVEGGEFVIGADTVIPAIGSRPDVGTVGGSTVTGERGTVEVSEDGRTAVEGVFAAGDVETGPSSVVESIGRGHIAARGIHAHLRGRRSVDLPPPAGPSVVPIPVVFGPSPTSPATYEPRRRAITDEDPFIEVDLPMTQHEAVTEASRCLNCGPCDLCRTCLPSCDHKQVLATVDGTSFLLKVPPELSREVAAGLDRVEIISDGGPRMMSLGTLTPTVAGALCIGCARCEEVCAYRAIGTVLRRGSTLTATVAHDACASCSACVSVCPTGAITQGPMSDSHLLDRLGAAAGDGGVAALVTYWLTPTPAFGGHRGAVEVMSERRPTPALLVRALTRTGRGVLVIGPDAGTGSHYLERGPGPEEAVAGARALLALVGISPERIRYTGLPRGADPEDALHRFRDDLDRLDLRPLDLPALGDPGGPLGGMMTALRIMASMPEVETEDPEQTLPPVRPGGSALFEGCLPMLSLVGDVTGLFDLTSARGALQRLTLDLGIADGHVPGLACPARGLATEAPAMAAVVRRIAALNRERLGGTRPSRLVVATPEALRSLADLDDVTVTSLPEALLDVMRDLEMGPVDMTVALHPACVMEDDPFAEPVRRVLAGIPGLRVVEIPGACGTSSLARPDARSRAEAEALLREALCAGADAVVCTSPNCLAHLKITQRDGSWRTVDMEVLDPWQLLRRDVGGGAR